MKLSIFREVSFGGNRHEQVRVKSDDFRWRADFQLSYTGAVL